MLHLIAAGPLASNGRCVENPLKCPEELHNILLHYEFGGTMCQMMISCALCGSIFALEFELIAGIEWQYWSVLESKLFDFLCSMTNLTMLVATSHLLAI
jgi:hypothetical protein